MTGIPAQCLFRPSSRVRRRASGDALPSDEPVGRPRRDRSVVTRVAVLAAVLAIALAGLVAVPAVHASGTLSGVVFRDYDADGARGSHEPGVGGVTVTAYDADGVAAGSIATCSATGVPAAGCTLSTLGAFDLAVSGTGPYRVEFTGLPPALRAGAVGADSGSRVQIVADPAGGTASGIDLGLANPAEYCLPGTREAAPCYVNGDPLTTPSGACPGGGSAAADFPAFVTFLDTVDSNNGTGVVHAADAGSLGSVWGLAWQRDSRSLFAAATVKRHCGLGPLPGGSGGSRTGVIYRLSGDLATDAAATVEPWFNLDDITGVDTGPEPAARGLDACTTVPSYDADAFDAVGKVGLGGLAIGDDGETLWVVDLYDRTLYELAVGSPPAVPGDAQVTVHPFGAAEPACTNGVFRPWAVKVHDGLVYVGGVCTGESGGSAADLSAHVLVHDPAGVVGNFTEIFQMDLDYPRGKVTASGAQQPLATWRPWISQWSDITSPAPGGGPFGQTLYPQPILADIEVDVDGSLVLGFLDRSGQQLGNNNYQTDGVDTTTYEGVAAGDLLRVCYDPDDSDANNNPYVLENGADCPGPGGPTVAADQVPPQGPGGREYYWSDYYRWDNDPNNPDGGTHQEIGLGGLAERLGSGEIGTSAFDPYDDYRSGGVAWLSHADGSRTHSLEVFGQDAGGRPATFGKAAGLGDLELLCDPAPLEIGNRVWCDDGDGVQEGGESPVTGIEVTLVCGTDDPVTTTTDGAGQYLFTDAAYAGVNGTPIPRHGSCTLSIDTAAEAATLNSACGSGVISPTTPNSGTGPAPDLADSDGVDGGGGIVEISIPDVGGDGDNDHSHDFGFVLGPELIGTLGDTVWCDGVTGFGNGVFDAGEGVAGVTVSLFEDTDCDDSPDGPAVASQETAGDGQYEFTALPVGPPGDPLCYVVQVDTADPDLGTCNVPITPTGTAPDLDSDNPNDPDNDFGFEEPCDDPDGDRVCNESCAADRDGDGDPDCSDFDPQGYIYCGDNGELVTGATIQVTGPGGVTLLEDGSTGRYSFATDGTPGHYTLVVTPPAGSPLSTDCTDQGTLDPTGGPNPTVLGSGEQLSSGALGSGACADNPYYLAFDLEPGDPVILNNNIPLQACAQPVTEVPALSGWGLALLALFLGVAGLWAVRS